MVFFNILKNWFKKFTKQQEVLAKPTPTSEKKESFKEKPLIVKKTKTQKTINVGIDFGTSSTKILYRDVTENKGSYLDIYEDIPPDGYNLFCMPSTIAINDNKIYFSSHAEKISGKSVTIRSFKICLVCEIMENFNCRLDENIIRRYCDDKQYRTGKRGEFLLKLDSSTALRVSAKEFVSYFLAYVMKRVRLCIDKKYSNEYILKYTYNICAPIDQYSIDQVKQCYERVFFLAEKLSYFIDNGIDVQIIKKMYSQLDREWKKIPGDEARNTFVLPETLASIMSYINSRRATDGLYAIVDIGAGTTDISFFRYASSLAGKVQGIYASQTILLGMDNFDMAIYKDIIKSFLDIKTSSDEKKFKLLQEIRVQKEKYMNNENNLIINIEEKQAIFKKERVEELAEPIKNDIFKLYKSLWGEAYKKELGESRWRNLILYIIGGGSRSLYIIRPFKDPPSYIVRNFSTRWVNIEDGILNLTNLDKELKNSSFLFSVAHGLSFHKVDWGKIIRAFEIDPLPARTVRQYRDRDDDR